MSQNAIKGSMPVYGCDAEWYSNHVIGGLRKALNVPATTLGSTGKKKENETSGDIDIAIEMEFTKENVEKVKTYLKEEYGDDVQIYVSDGFKIVSFGLKYKTICMGLFGSEMYAQVDLMFSTDLEYSKFMYHSPNYKNNESNFKGLYRTNLLAYIAGRTPHGVEDVYNDDGELMDYWKYTLTYDKGLVFTHKTYRGKTKRLKNPVTVKEDTRLISKEPKTIINFILGNKATLDTANSFESLITYLFSDDYPYKKHRSEIMNDYLHDERQLPMIMEVINYTNKVIKNEPDTVNFLIDNLLGHITYDNV